VSDVVPIGLVGLGAIGRPIGRALSDAGFRLAVCDTRREATDEFASAGAIACESPAAVASAAETVFVSLPTPDVVRAVACGEDGLVHGSRIRTYVDLSTTGAGTAAEVASSLAARGIVAVDAPVSGGVAGAEARTLAVMVATDEGTFAAVRPLLETFGKNVFHVGETPGQGQIAKLLNNLLSATAIALTSEAVALGIECGLEAATLLDVFNASSGRNTATSDKFPKHVLTRGFGSGFRLELMAKDVELCQQEARSRRFPMPVGSLVQQLWTIGARQLPEDADHTEYARLVEQWTGVELRLREEARP
jgi:3-hydroxyisobutyrate dehydrogenase-like beta-hydroxyacid dehydrogenase